MSSMTIKACCHLPGTLAMTRCSVTCVTFAVFWWIAFLRLLMSGRVWVKTWAFKYPPQKTINSPKNVIRQEIANVTQVTLHRVMESVPGRWQQCLDCHGGHLQDVVLKTWGFLWIQDAGLLGRVAVYNKCVILLSKWVTLNAAFCRLSRSWRRHVPSEHRKLQRRNVTI